MPIRSYPKAKGLMLAAGVAIASLLAFGGRTADGLSAQEQDPNLLIPPRTWATECANNEVLVIQHPDSFLRYRLHEVDEKGDRVRDQIETPEGSVGRLIFRDGRSLTHEEDAAERDRLNGLLGSRSNFARHIHREQENKKIGMKLIRELPDAMIWSYAPGQPQPPDHPAGATHLIVLDFKANPQWSAPDMESEPLTGLEGRVWIDPQTHRLVHLEGGLTHAVNIGWGMVAHIYPGGKVTLEQTNAGGQRWIVQHVVEQVTLRALMVKSIKQRLVFDTSDFQQIKPMSYQEAIKVLLNTPGSGR